MTPAPPSPGLAAKMTQGHRLNPGRKNPILICRCRDSGRRALLVDSPHESAYTHEKCFWRVWRREAA